MYSLFTITLLSFAAFFTNPFTTVSPAPADQVEHYNFTYNGPFPHSVINACNGEEVVLNGTAHVHEWGTILPNGNTHAHFHQNFSNIVGIGQTTGTVYNCVGSYNYHFNTSVGTTETATLTQNLISTVGDGPSFTIQANYHLTVNANGTTTVEFENFNAPCL